MQWYRRSWWRWNWGAYSRFPPASYEKCCWCTVLATVQTGNVHTHYLETWPAASGRMWKKWRSIGHPCSSMNCYCLSCNTAYMQMKHFLKNTNTLLKSDMKVVQVPDPKNIMTQQSCLASTMKSPLQYPYSSWYAEKGGQVRRLPFLSFFLHPKHGCFMHYRQRSCHRT